MFLFFCESEMINAREIFPKHFQSYYNKCPIYQAAEDRAGRISVLCNIVRILLRWFHSAKTSDWYSPFIIWLAPRAGKMNQIARCDWLPERARWSHLARSGLPAVSRMKNFPESHIINPLLTKLLRSRWLDIGLVLFFRVYGPRLRLGP